MTESNIVLSQSEYEQLLEEIRELQARITELTALRDDLVYHVCPALSAEYEEKIVSLEQERQRLRNQLRRPKDPQLTEQIKGEIHGISERLKPLRNDLAAAVRIDDTWRHVYEMLQTEHDMEARAQIKERT